MGHKVETLLLIVIIAREKLDRPLLFAPGVGFPYLLQQFLPPKPIFIHHLAEARNAENPSAGFSFFSFFLFHSLRRSPQVSLSTACSRGTTTQLDNFIQLSRRALQSCSPPFYSSYPSSADSKMVDHFSLSFFLSRSSQTSPSGLFLFVLPLGNERRQGSVDFKAGPTLGRVLLSLLPPEWQVHRDRSQAERRAKKTLFFIFFF